MTEDEQPARRAASGPPRKGLASATLGALRIGHADQPVADPATSDDAGPEVEPADVEGLQLGAVVEGDVIEGDADADDIEDAAADVAAAPVGTRTSPAKKAPPAARPGRRRRTSPWTAACALLAFAALIFAVVTGIGWWTAGHNDQRDLGLARDRISTDARLAIVTVNTSDYRQPAAALANWLRVSTGSLHAQYVQSRTAATKLLGEAKMITKATVLDAAVSDVDLNKGVASVIASVNVTRTPTSGSPTTVRNRFRGTLKRVGGEWKLSDLAVVPVSLS